MLLDYFLPAFSFSLNYIHIFYFSAGCNLLYYDSSQDNHTHFRAWFGNRCNYHFWKSRFFPLVRSKQGVNTDILSVFSVCRPVPNRGYSLHLLHSDAAYFSHASYICVILLFLLLRWVLFIWLQKFHFNAPSMLVTPVWSHSVLSAPNGIWNMLNFCQTQTRCVGLLSSPKLVQCLMLGIGEM